MTNPQNTTLVLKDQAGSYFLVSQETLERGRVPEQHTAEVERLIATAGQGGVDGDDVHGHHPVAIGIAVACVLYTGFDLGYDLTKKFLGPEAQVPTLDLSASASPERPR